ncbi:TetR/AcrR family transcriptional regulator [Kutzneria sp. 744]|uniref:TetR/AcrR family transcriptional regulator n=1 Tax=Kutzneria sp. (strain 744) TaxID=345341 RepID=UPI0003EEA8CD|nr:TetR/AcrR family transcriptional regulator [Kutzneria sp. 744]EWM12310.1 transcriptional regulator [Kutzneria sp. 744]
MTGGRPYHSPRRAQEAAETRRDIVRAAAELFATNGYARVTVADIARAAGVAQQTVYSSAGSKSDILDEVLAEAIRNSGGDANLAEIRLTDDLPTALALLAHGTRLGNESQEQAVDIIFGAMPVHENAAQLWAFATGQYRETLGQIAEHLRDKGLVEDAERTTAVLWFYFGLHSWRSLVRDNGWTWDDAENWLARQALAALG